MVVTLSVDSLVTNLIVGKVGSFLIDKGYFLWHRRYVREICQIPTIGGVWFGSHMNSEYFFSSFSLRTVAWWSHVFVCN